MADAGEHDWEKTEGSLAPGLRGPPELWAKSACRKCGTVRTDVMGVATYEPPGEDAGKLGQSEPPCRP